MLRLAIILHLVIAVVLFIFGVREGEDFSGEALFSLSYATLSLAIAFFALHVSEVQGKRHQELLDEQYGALKRDVRRIREHLAVPESVQDARMLADRMQSLEWKVDEIRKRPRWKFWA